MTIQALRRQCFRWSLGGVILACLAAVGSGCRSTPRASSASVWSYPPGVCPRFYAQYLPYPRRGLPVAQPMPATPGWTDPRIERDLARLTDAGLDGILLTLQPDVLADPVQTERVQRFLALAADRAPSGWEVILMLVTPADTPIEVDRNALGRWLTTQGLLEHPILRRRSGRIVVLLAPGVHAAGAPHPAVAAIACGALGSEWSWPAPAASERFAPTGPDRQVVVYGGSWTDIVGPDGVTAPGWALERRQGRTLQDELQRAFDAQAMTICIASWNDYSAGSFVEPNSLDGMNPLRRLTGTLRAARNHAAATAVAPAAP